MDEPGSDEAIQSWIACAERMKEWAPDVRLWVNPGEANGGTPHRVVKILPYVNAFCPYFNHWTFKGNNAEFNAYMGDQSVSIYRGAALRTISTRNAEAIREAVQRFRQAKCDQLHPKEAPSAP